MHAQSFSHFRLFYDPLDYSLLGSSVRGTLQARILEWIAIFFSRESSQPRDQTLISCVVRWILYHGVTRDAHVQDYGEG